MPHYYFRLHRLSDRRKPQPGDMANHDGIYADDAAAVSAAKEYGQKHRSHGVSFSGDVLVFRDASRQIEESEDGLRGPRSAGASHIAGEVFVRAVSI